MEGMQKEITTPRLSIIVISDYAAGKEKSWQDLRRALEGWAGQKGPPADEFLYVESTRYEAHIPPELTRLVPHMKVVSIEADSSYELKNRAVEIAGGDWVAIVDADCIPQQAWLEELRRILDAYPGMTAVSAKTMYAGRTRLERLCGLLSRSYLDPGGRGPTRFISGNAACFRREWYLRHPLPVGLGAFASRIQSEAFLRDGATLLFAPELLVVHDFEGWSMEKDIRRNYGYSTVATRLRDHRLPFARLVRMGLPVIPFIVAGKVFNSVRDCLRCFPHYHVKPSEVPLALFLLVVTHILEIPGMVAAYRNRNVGETAYR